MGIKATVRHFINCYTAEVEFSETAMSFYGPSWEIGLFFGLIPIRGKTKELLRIEYSDIEEVQVAKSSEAFSKKDVCVIRTKGEKKSKAANNLAAIEVGFIPFEAGREMLFERVGDRFI